MRQDMLDFIGLAAWVGGLGRIRVADRTLGEFDTEIDRLIKLRSSNPESGLKDLLARLIAARDEQTGGGMSAQEVRDHVITIFMAGHETTPTAMARAWCLFLPTSAPKAKPHALLHPPLRWAATPPRG